VRDIRREFPLAAFAFAQRIVRARPLADVADHREILQWFTTDILHDGLHGFARKHISVLAHVFDIIGFRAILRAPDLT
jgi:hypothetical protein